MKAIRISKKKIAVICIVVTSAVLAIWTAWGNTALMVNAVTISGSRILAAFSGFQIAQVSDLHNAEFGKNNVELVTYSHHLRGRKLLLFRSCVYSELKTF